MKRISRISAFLLVSLLVSCNKKDDPNPIAPAQLLSGRTWILNTLTSTDPGFQSSGQILLSSEWSFKPDKSFSMHVSVSGVDLTFTGSWSLAADNKTLMVTSNIGGTPALSYMEILSITSTALELKETAAGMTNTYSFSAKP